ncbi:MAG: hypothetical protein WCC95_12415 [Candidatus Sulfotelmatobacter sp.]|jgi:hypothetical protein
MADVRLALLARVEAKAGKEADVENFLRSALSMVEEEPETVVRDQDGTLDIWNL